MDEAETMDPTDPTSEPEAPPLPSLPLRLLNVFFAPGELMVGLKRKPAWVGAVAVGAVFVALGTILIPADIFMATMREGMIEGGGQVPDNLENMAGVFRIGGSVAGFAFWWAITAAMAGVVTLIFAFLLGDGGTYRQYLAVLAHAFLIAAVGTLVVLPLRISAEDAQMMLSIGTFLPFLEEGYFVRVLNLLDLFGLWAWAIVGVGVATIEPKRTVGSAIGIVMVVPVVIALIFGIFGG